MVVNIFEGRGKFSLLREGVRGTGESIFLGGGRACIPLAQKFQLML